MRRIICLIMLGALLGGCAGSAGKVKGSEAHYLLGVSYLQEQNPTLALKEFLQAEALDSRDADIQAGLGQAYQLKRAFAEAEKHYLRALKLRRDDPQIQNNLVCLKITVV